MVVSQTTNTQTVVADGVKTAYDFTDFRILNSSHLEVYVNEVLQTLTTDYTLTFNEDSAGGTATFTTAPTNGHNIFFKRVVPNTQDTGLPLADKFPSTRVEKQFDLVVMMVQQLAEQLGRTLTVNQFSSSVSTELPVPEALKIFGWNAAANAIQNFDVATGTFIFPSFTGNGLKLFRVNAAENGLEFTEVQTANLANDAVTFAKMQNLGYGQVIGRLSSGTGDPEALTLATETLASGSVTNLASIDFTSLLDRNKYRAYRMYLDLYDSTSGNLSARFSNNNGATWISSATYRTMRQELTGAGVLSPFTGSAATSMAIVNTSNATDSRAQISCDIILGATRNCSIMFQGVSHRAAVDVIYTHGGGWHFENNIDAIQVFGSGNISGKYKLEGVLI